MTRIVVLGDLNVDVVAVQETSLAHGSDTAARVSLQPGGGGANVAAWLAKLGVEVTLIGRVGKDALAPVALSGLDGVDLQVVHDPQRATGTCIVLVSPGGERTMLPDPGANDAIAVGDLPPLDGDILHVSGYSLMRPGSRAAAMAAIDRAREAGMKISVDPASAAPLANDPVFLQRIAPIDLLLPNADEAAVLGPQIDVPELVVKFGADGARWTNGVDTVTGRAVPVDEVVDTTGAGDAFAAGFLSVWPTGTAGDALAAGAQLRGRGRRARRIARLMTRILFVCMGNICRSPTAEGVMRHLVREAGLEDEIVIDSAGTGGWHAGDPPDRRATAAARARGVTLEGGARQITVDDFEDFDLLLAMDRDNLAGIRAIAPDAGGRREGAAPARVRPGERRRTRPRRPRPVLRRPPGLRDRARPGRGRMPRPAR